MTLASEIGGTLTTRTLRTVAEVRQIADDWRDLFHRSHTTAFQSPDWLLPWIEIFAPHKMLMLEIRRSGRLIGLAPFLIYSRDTERVLAFMGGGVSDYLNLLVEPGFEACVISEVFSAVVTAQEDWTVLDLTDLPQYSSLLSALLLRPHSRKHDNCSVLDLPQSPNGLLHVFSNRQRANLRNARSRLQRAGGGAIEIATPENVFEFLDDLFVLHTSRWSEQGQSGVLADDRIREFHKICAPRLLQDGLLHLSRLRVVDRTAAVIHSLYSAGTAYCYLQGFNPHFSFLSPGTQLMFSVISDAVDGGMRRFDFLRGQEAYKQHWRVENQSTFRIQLSRSVLADIFASKTAPVAA